MHICKKEPTRRSERIKKNFWKRQYTLPKTLPDLLKLKHDCEREIEYYARGVFTAQKDADAWAAAGVEDKALDMQYRANCHAEKLKQFQEKLADTDAEIARM
jgi:aromatic ring hydroxylase